MHMRDRVQKVVELAESMEKLYEFLQRLDDEFSDMLDELNEATEENAVAVCRNVADRLDRFYQEL